MTNTSQNSCIFTGLHSDLCLCVCVYTHTRTCVYVNEQKKILSALGILLWQQWRLPLFLALFSEEFQFVQLLLSPT